MYSCWQGKNGLVYVCSRLSFGIVSQMNPVSLVGVMWLLCEVCLVPLMKFSCVESTILQISLLEGRLVLFSSGNIVRPKVHCKFQQMMSFFLMLNFFFLNRFCGCSYYLLFKAGSRWSSVLRVATNIWTGLEFWGTCESFEVPEV